MLGPIKQFLNAAQITFNHCTLLPITLAKLIDIVESNTVSFSVASTKLLPILNTTNEDPLQLAQSLNLVQVSNTNDLEIWVLQVLNNMPDKVLEYKKGKKGLIGLFVGEVKKISKGKADPKAVTDLIIEKLSV